MHSGGSQVDGYARLGLRGNPFVAEAAPGVAADVFLDVGIPDPPASGVVELVGCKGAGKTTHLLRWCAAMGGSYTHVGPGLGRLTWLPLDAVVAWDEVDRLPRPVLAARVRAARRREALVLLGTHVATGLADRSHDLPAPDATSVQAFAARRIAATRIAATPTGAITTLALPAACAEDVARHSGGCWWTVGTALHIWAAELAQAAGRQEQT